MKIKNIDIIFESFKDAKVKFKDEASSNEVDKYIEIFKKLAQKNIIKGSDKDIGKWIKSGWQEFKTFVDDRSEEKTKSEVKRSKKKDSIIAYEDENIMVVIPLSEDASCYYGKQTKWCTAATTSRNYFHDYFYKDDIVLFYVLHSNGSKYASAYNTHKDTFEFFDSEDQSIDHEQFKKVTNINKDMLIGFYNKYKKVIENVQDINKMSDELQIKMIKSESTYFRKIKNPSEKVKLAAVNFLGFLIKDINDPSEDVQITAVEESGDNIKYLYEKGISPSEDVQLVAVNNSPASIQFIKEPSEKVQLQAVHKNSWSIKYIKNPTEKVINKAVSQNPNTISLIRDRSEELEMMAVKKLGNAIQYIRSPSEEVQLAAVTQNGTAISFISSPSDKIKNAAIKSSKEAIDYMVPYDEQLKLHKRLWG